MPDASLSRRTVLLTSGALGAAAALAACGGSTSSGGASASAATSSTPAGGSSSPGGTVLAQVSAVPVEGGVVNDAAQVVVTQPAQGSIKAFTAVCPHQGCLVNQVKANQIVCPCHGSLFSAETGAVLQGPATTGLAPVNVTVSGDTVTLG